MPTASAAAITVLRLLLVHGYTVVAAKALRLEGGPDSQLLSVVAMEGQDGRRASADVSAQAGPGSQRESALTPNLTPTAVATDQASLVAALQVDGAVVDLQADIVINLGSPHWPTNGIYMLQKTATIFSSTGRKTISGDGTYGCLAIDYGTLYLYDITLARCVAKGGGGGAIWIGHSTVYATRLLVEDNTEAGGGSTPGIWAWYSVFSCTDCIFRGNSGEHATAMSARGHSLLTLSNVIFEGNTCTGGGCVSSITDGPPPFNFYDVHFADGEKIARQYVTTSASCSGTSTPMTDAFCSGCAGLPNCARSALQLWDLSNLPLTLAPTPAPTSATPAPTAATPGAGGAGAGASAVGDPHLQNVHGERFDLMKAGKHVLINVPRGMSANNALLRVQADARRLGGHCADMYFQEVNVTGSWAEAKQAGGYHYSAKQVDVETPEWVAFGKVGLKVVHGRTDTGLSYLNVYVKHLGRAGFAVGGLLGEDDHDDVITPPADCAKRMALLETSGKSQKVPSVLSVAEASLA